MASTGTGLPTQRGERVLAQPGGTPAVINADAYSTARDWTEVAAAGAKFTDVAERALHQADVGYLADQSVEIARKRADMRDEFADNPGGFDAAWKGYTDGKLSEAEPRAVPHIKRVLATEGNAAYSTLLSERRAKDEKLNAQSVDALASLTGNDVVGAAMAGTLNTPDGQIKVAKYRAVLDSGVTSGLMPKEKADLLFDDKMSAAQGEIAARDGVEVYRQKGFAAAEQHLRSTILENENLTLKGESRYKAFGRGLQAIKLAQAGDKEDRVATIEIGKELEARYASNQPVEPAELRDTLAALSRSGAAAAHRRLAVASAVSDATAPYRTGLNLREFASAVSGARTASLPPGIGEIVTDEAQKAGIDPKLAARIAKLESGGDPNAVTKSGTYKGLFQLSDAEFKANGGTNITDARENAAVATQKLAREIGAFRQQFGREPSATDIYLTHQQGAGGIAAHLANPDAPAWQNMASTAEGRKKGEAWAKDAIWGNVPDDVKAKFGSVDNLTSGQFVELWRQKVEGGPAPLGGAAGTLYPDAVTKQVQQVFVKQAREAWPDIKMRIDQGKVLSQDDFTSVRYAAALSGDANWQKQVEDLAVANGIGKEAAKLPVGQRQALVDEARGALGAEIAESIEKQLTRQRKMVADDPVGFAMERGRQAPAALDLSTSDTARASVGQRVKIAQAVAEEQQTAPGNPFRPAEVSAIAGAITTGKPAQAAVALDAIASLPDEMLTPALANEGIKQAVVGAVRSGDATRFNSAMSFMDRMWARGPETTKALFGEDAVHDLMTWQSNLRYMTPEQLSKERDKKALDPGMREQLKTLNEAGQKEARKMKFEDVVGTFDSSWWITPGPIARALGSQPVAPTDGMTRAALMADHEAVYARRYAETFGDKDKAAEQTLALLKTKWTASPVNGGKLMLNAPESLRDSKGNPVYPAVDGSWDWMTKQVEGDLTKRLGPRGPAFSEAQRKGEAPIPTPLSPNWDYTLVSDRQTAAEAAAGKPASYLIIVKDNKTGQQTPIPTRYAFDPTPVVAKGRADFDAQRARQNGAFQSISGDMKGMFDPTIGGKAYAVP